MVRSRWIGPLVVLASTGLAWGEGAAPAPRAEGAAGHEIKVQELGRPPQRCKVLKTWQERDGGKAYQVQALDTGEMMTIAESEISPSSSPYAPGGAHVK